MELLRLYGCLSDATRLRIVNLLRGGPLCVCHIQEILGEPQVKVSKHLAILKDAGVVEARREANWMIYSLPDAMSAALRANLDLLEKHGPATLAGDNAGLDKLRAAMPAGSPSCTLKKPSGKGVLRPSEKTGTSRPLKISR